MIFSPVTAGLYSLNILGRMAISWINIISRTVELLARIMSPQAPQMSQIISERRHTVAVPSHSGGTLEAEEGHRHSTRFSFDLRARLGLRRVSDPGPVRSHDLVTPKRATEPTENPTESPVERLQTSPIQSSITIASTAINSKKLRQHRAKHSEINIKEELPHRVHTRAVIAGAVGIHVPKRFERLLKARNWDRLLHDHFREITTEHTREPSSDPLFDEFSQYVLPPTAVLLDRSFRVYPESMFRDAAAGLLQLGFGLYQLVSSDAHMSVQKDGMASPYLLVLPYLGMAAVNTVINILDPPYSVVTVLDISRAAQRFLHTSRAETDSYATPAMSIDPNYSMSGPSFQSPRLETEQSASSRYKSADLRIETSTIWEDRSVQFDTPDYKSPYPLIYSDRDGTWPELVEWLDFAYEKRLDICPVDRLYQNPRLSHAVIIAEFVWTTFNALLVPMVLLAVVGSWTRFQTSTYGVSLGFNILALFGLPFIQFILGTSHSFARLRRDLRGRKKHGTPYWEPRYQDADEEKGKQKSYWKWMTKRSKERSSWWDLIAQSVGLYFPARKTIIVVYVVLVVGVAICEFTLVGLNLMRTLNCDMTLLM